MLVNVGIKPFLLYSFNVFMKSGFLFGSIGSSITPIQFPFTNSFELEANCSGEHSKRIRIGVFSLNHLIIGYAEVPLVTYALIDRCLCNPMLPPSGVSSGSIKPH